MPRYFFPDYSEAEIEDSQVSLAEDQYGAVPIEGDSSVDMAFPTLRQIRRVPMDEVQRSQSQFGAKLYTKSMRELDDPFLASEFESVDFQTGEDRAQPAAAATFREAFPDWIGREPADVSSLKGFDTYQSLLEEKAQGPRGFWGQVVLNEIEDIPFVGAVAETLDTGKILITVNKLKAGEEVSDQDVLDLNLFLAEAERDSAATIPGKVGSIIRQSMTFGLEIAGTLALAALLPGPGTVAAGAMAPSIWAKISGRTAYKAAGKALSEALKKLGAKKSIGAVGRYVARPMVAEALTAPLIAGAAGTLATQIPSALASLAAGEGVQSGRANIRQIYGGLSGKDETYLKSYAMGTLANFIEHASEFTGEYAIIGLGKIGAKIPGVAKAMLAGQKLRGMFSTAAAKTAGEAVEAGQKAVGKMAGLTAMSTTLVKLAQKLNVPIDVALKHLRSVGFDGIVEEFAEERIGNFFHGLFGTEGDEAGLRAAFNNAIPTGEDAIAELLAFTFPIAAVSSLNSANFYLKYATTPGFGAVLKKVREVITPPTRVNAKGETIAAVVQTEEERKDSSRKAAELIQETSDIDNLLQNKVLNFTTRLLMFPFAPDVLGVQFGSLDQALAQTNIAALGQRFQTVKSTYEKDHPKAPKGEAEAVALDDITLLLDNVYRKVVTLSDKKAEATPVEAPPPIPAPAPAQTVYEEGRAAEEVGGLTRGVLGVEAQVPVSLSFSEELMSELARQGVAIVIPISERNSKKSVAHRYAMEMDVDEAREILTPGTDPNAKLAFIIRFGIHRKNSPQSASMDPTRRGWVEAFDRWAAPRLNALNQAASSEVTLGSWLTREVAPGKHQAIYVTRVEGGQIYGYQIDAGENPITDIMELSEDNLAYLKVVKDALGDRMPLANVPDLSDTVPGAWKKVRTNTLVSTSGVRYRGTLDEIREMYGERYKGYSQDEIARKASITLEKNEAGETLYDTIHAAWHPVLGAVAFDARFGPANSLEDLIERGHTAFSGMVNVAHPIFTRPGGIFDQVKTYLAENPSRQDAAVLLERLTNPTQAEEFELASKMSEMFLDYDPRFYGETVEELVGFEGFMAISGIDEERSGTLMPKIIGPALMQEFDALMTSILGVGWKLKYRNPFAERPVVAGISLDVGRNQAPPPKKPPPPPSEGTPSAPKGPKAKVAPAAPAAPVEPAEVPDIPPAAPYNPPTPRNIAPEEPSRVVPEAPEATPAVSEEPSREVSSEEAPRIIAEVEAPREIVEQYRQGTSTPIDRNYDLSEDEVNRILGDQPTPPPSSEALSVGSLKEATIKAKDELVDFYRATLVRYLGHEPTPREFIEYLRDDIRLGSDEIRAWAARRAKGIDAAVEPEELPSEDSDNPEGDEVENMVGEYMSSQKFIDQVFAREAVRRSMGALFKKTGNLQGIDPYDKATNVLHNMMSKFLLPYKAAGDEAASRRLAGKDWSDLRGNPVMWDEEAFLAWTAEPVGGFEEIARAQMRLLGYVNAQETYVFYRDMIVMHPFVNETYKDEAGEIQHRFVPENIVDMTSVLETKAQQAMAPEALLAKALAWDGGVLGFLKAWDDVVTRIANDYRDNGEADPALFDFFAELTGIDIGVWQTAALPANRRQGGADVYNSLARILAGGKFLNRAKVGRMGNEAMPNWAVPFYDPRLSIQKAQKAIDTAIAKAMKSKSKELPEEGIAFQRNIIQEQFKEWVTRMTNDVFLGKTDASSRVSDSITSTVSKLAQQLRVGVRDNIPRKLTAKSPNGKDIPVVTLHSTATLAYLAAHPDAEFIQVAGTRNLVTERNRDTADMTVGEETQTLRDIYKSRGGRQMVATFLSGEKNILIGVMVDSDPPAAGESWEAAYDREWAKKREEIDEIVLGKSGFWKKQGIVAKLRRASQSVTPGEGLLDTKGGMSLLPNSVLFEGNEAKHGDGAGIVFEDTAPASKGVSNKLGITGMHVGSEGTPRNVKANFARRTEALANTGGYYTDVDARVQKHNASASAEDQITFAYTSDSEKASAEHMASKLTDEKLKLIPTPLYMIRKVSELNTPNEIHPIKVPIQLVANMAALKNSAPVMAAAANLLNAQLAAKPTKADQSLNESVPAAMTDIKQLLNDGAFEQDNRVEPVKNRIRAAQETTRMALTMPGFHAVLLEGAGADHVREMSETPDGKKIWATGQFHSINPGLAQPRRYEFTAETRDAQRELAENELLAEARLGKRWDLVERVGGNFPAKPMSKLTREDLRLHEIVEVDSGWEVPGGIVLGARTPGSTVVSYVPFRLGFDPGAEFENQLILPREVTDLMGADFDGDKLAFMTANQKSNGNYSQSDLGAAQNEFLFGILDLYDGMPIAKLKQKLDTDYYKNTNKVFEKRVEEKMEKMKASGLYDPVAFEKAQHLLKDAVDLIGTIMSIQSTIDLTFASGATHFKTHRTIYSRKTGQPYNIQVLPVTFSTLGGGTLVLNRVTPRDEAREISDEALLLVIGDISNIILDNPKTNQATLLSLTKEVANLFSVAMIAGEVTQKEGQSAREAEDELFWKTINWLRSPMMKAYVEFATDAHSIYSTGNGRLEIDALKAALKKAKVSDSEINGLLQVRAMANDLYELGQALRFGNKSPGTVESYWKAEDAVERVKTNALNTINTEKLNGTAQMNMTEIRLAEMRSNVYGEARHPYASNADVKQTLTYHDAEAINSVLDGMPEDYVQTAPAPAKPVLRNIRNADEKTKLNSLSARIKNYRWVAQVNALARKDHGAPSWRPEFAWLPGLSETLVRLITEMKAADSGNAFLNVLQVGPGMTLYVNPETGIGFQTGNIETIGVRGADQGTIIAIREAAEKLQLPEGWTLDQFLHGMALFSAWRYGASSTLTFKNPQLLLPARTQVLVSVLSMKEHQLGVLSKEGGRSFEYFAAMHFILGINSGSKRKNSERRYLPVYPETMAEYSEPAGKAAPVSQEEAAREIAASNVDPFDYLESAPGISEEPEDLGELPPSSQDLLAPSASVAPVAQAPAPSAPATTFVASKSAGYPARTYANAAMADVTVDFAMTPTGSGGARGLTRIAAEKAKKVYINVPVTATGFDPLAASKVIVDAVKRGRLTVPELSSPWSLNFAGHELGKMRLSQAEIDSLVDQTMKKVQFMLSLDGTTIKSIRSGGQTGFDEAGIKAGVALGVPTEVLAPKEWNFRPTQRDVVGNEAAFKARFAAPVAQAPAPSAPKAKPQVLTDLSYLPQSAQEMLAPQETEAEIEARELRLDLEDQRLEEQAKEQAELAATERELAEVEARAGSEALSVGDLRALVAAGILAATSPLVVEAQQAPPTEQRTISLEDVVAESLRDFEGLILTMKLDAGYPAIGYGVRMFPGYKADFERITGKNFEDLREGRESITPEQAEELLYFAIAETQKRARDTFPNYNSFPISVKAAVINLTYMNVFPGFPEATKAMQRGDFAAAAYEVEHSETFRSGGQNEVRLHQAANILRANASPEALSVGVIHPLERNRDELLAAGASLKEALAMAAIVHRRPNLTKAEKSWLKAAKVSEARVDDFDDIMAAREAATRRVAPEFRPGLTLQNVVSTTAFDLKDPVDRAAFNKRWNPIVGKLTQLLAAGDAQRAFDYLDAQKQMPPQLKNKLEYNFMGIRPKWVTANQTETVNAWRQEHDSSPFQQGLDFDEKEANNVALSIGSLRGAIELELATVGATGSNKLGKILLEEAHLADARRRRGALLYARIARRMAFTGDIKSMKKGANEKVLDTLTEDEQIMVRQHEGLIASILNHEIQVGEKHLFEVDQILSRKKLSDADKRKAIELLLPSITIVWNRSVADGVGKTESAADFLKRWYASTAYQKLSAHRTEAELDWYDRVKEIHAEYAALREEHGLPYREGYIGRQVYGLGFRNKALKAAEDRVKNALALIKRGGGTETLMPDSAYEADYARSEAPKSLSEQRQLYSRLTGAPEADVAGKSMWELNSMILFELYNREVTEAEDMGEKYNPENVDRAKALRTLNALTLALKNYRYKEFARSALHRTLEGSYARIYRDSPKRVKLADGTIIDVRRAPHNLNAAENLRDYTNEVTSAAYNRTLLRKWVLTPDVDGRPMVLAIPGEFTQQRPLIPEDVMWEMAKRWAGYHGLQLDPTKSLASQIDTLSRDYASSDDYETLKSPYPSVREFRVLKGRPVMIMKHLIQPEFQWIVGNYDTAKALMAATQMSKSNSVAYSLFFPWTLFESVVAGTGFKNNFLWTKDPKTGKRSPMVAINQLKDIWSDISTADPIWADMMENMVLGGVKIGHLQSANEATGIIDTTFDSIAERARLTMGDKVAENVKAGLRALSGRQLTERLFGKGGKYAGVFPVLKMWFAQRLAEEAAASRGLNFHDLSKKDKVEMFKAVAGVANAAIGGVDWDTIPGATPQVQQAMNMSWFAPQWTISTATVGGLSVFLGQFFEHYLSEENLKFVAKNWMTMTAIVLFGFPALLQAGIWAAAAVSGGGEDDDEPFMFNNEEGRKWHVDITPLARNMPGYKGSPTGERRVYVRWGKQSYEVLNGWLQEPVNQALRKLSQPAKLLLEQLTGKSPGSDWNLEFAGQGLKGWLMTDAEGMDAFLTSRWGYVVQKFIPMSALTTVRNPEAFPFTFLAPVSKGMSSGKAAAALITVLNTYANEEVWKGLRKNPKAQANLNDMAPAILEAARKNGYDTDEIVRTAKGAVLTGLYKKFFEALESKNFKQMDALSRRIYRVGGTLRGLQNSMANRAKKAGMTLSPEEESAIAEAFN